MIVKKMKNKEPSKSKGAHISDTLDYIRAIDKDNPRDKVLYYGTHNMRSQEYHEIKMEMIELAEKSIKSKNPMQHVLLSFRREDQITEEQIREATSDFLRDMGYENCQMVYAVHHNTENFHVHMVINRIDPETHTARTDAHDIEKMHRSIARMQEKFGWSGEEHERYVMIEGEAVRAIYANKENEVKLSDKARVFELRQGEKSMQRIALEEVLPILKDAKSWPELHERLAGIGFSYEKKGGGAVLKAKTPEEEIEVKPSSLAKWASLKHMEKRIGTFTPSKVKEIEPREPQPMPEVPKEIFDQYRAVKSERRLEIEKEYREFEEEKKELAQERKQTLEIIKSADLDWSGKELALAALHKATKEIHIEDCASLEDRYRKKLEKGKELIAKSSNFEIWLKHELQPERVQEILRNIERTPYTVQIPSSPIIDHSLEKKKELFLQYHRAVGAERYRVTCSGKDIKGIKRVLILDKDKEDITRGYTAEQILRCLGDRNFNSFGKSFHGMSHFEAKGEHIYFTPLSEDKWHFFIDDLTPQNLEKLRRDGLSPACIINTSPQNYQAIFTIPKLHTQYENDIINDLATGLNLRYGDVGLCGAIHPHRAPGFWNTKDEYKTNHGYPIVSIIESTGNQCAILQKYMNYINGYYEYKNQNIEYITNNQNVSSRLVDDLSYTNDKSRNISLKIYEEHRKAILKIINIDDGLQDKSRLDAMIAIRLRGTGHSQAEIEKMIYNYNLATGREKHDLSKYAEKTANFAFSAEGTYRLEQMKTWIGQWKTLENNIINEMAIIQQEQEREQKLQLQKTLEKEKGRERHVIHTRPDEGLSL